MSTEEIAEAAERLAAEGKPLAEDEPLPITMDTISAIELQQMEIPPITFVVESLLHHGLRAYPKFTGEQGIIFYIVGERTL